MQVIQLLQDAKLFLNIYRVACNIAPRLRFHQYGDFCLCNRTFSPVPLPAHPLNQGSPDLPEQIW